MAQHCLLCVRIAYYEQLILSIIFSIERLICSENQTLRAQVDTLQLLFQSETQIYAVVLLSKIKNYREYSHFRKCEQ